MSKVIYEGLITDPNDPVYKRGWTVTIYSKNNSRRKQNEKKRK